MILCTTHPAAPVERFVSSGRQCPAGVCGSSCACIGCTLWLYLESELGKPV